MTKREAEVIKVILDNDEEIICTPDHLFMLKDGTYKKAQDLTNFDSLMPLYRKLSKKEGKITIKGYEMVYASKKRIWIFTHLLADDYNIRNKVYTSINGTNKHHIDFNKLNNNPDNIKRMSREDHFKYHQEMIQFGLHREDVKEKCRKIHQTEEFRKKISQIMSTPEMKAMLSNRAKKQWKNEEYKKYMTEKFLEFYKNNTEYRNLNNSLLNKVQKIYWGNTKNRKKQSERVKRYFETHPEKKKELYILAKKEWENVELLKWRRETTKKQWTPEFRIKRKTAYNQTYLDKFLRTMKLIAEQLGKIDKEEYQNQRIKTNDKSLLKYETILNRFFNGNARNLTEAVHRYNHKIEKIVRLDEKMDVYDLEVEGTHNFALASGIFVHNSMKSARDRRFQAILPLRGKILNVEKARIDKMLASKEVRAMVIALGTAIGEDFNIEKIRYHRIVLAADADVDGSHIRTLLLTFFYRYFRPVIEKGYLYIAQPPLYKIWSGKKTSYAYNEEEKDKVLNQFKKDKLLNLSIQRYKGLGEMNPEQLWETTINPANRVLLRVTMDDAKEADRIFDTLMGEEVLPRKKFIQTMAKKVRNLDI
ncbi:MAG: toprim domain-containing protein [Candidatus Nealsonbacteria bacterium]|nr:toprim domain-containing protein [Candidatus Nealsonbacteria bacterium]